jgi:two-component system CheB/CheR fusion protein
MVLAEALGEEDFRRRVKIYATDVDDEALRSARQAAYPREALRALPPGFLERYFERGPHGHTFRTDLRRLVIFGRNDMVQDAPISRIDLLVSRNALMYFTPEAQARILRHFNFALKDAGFLFLGKSEMLVTHTDLFIPHALKGVSSRRSPPRACATVWPSSPMPHSPQPTTVTGEMRAWRAGRSTRPRWRPSWSTAAAP